MTLYDASAISSKNVGININGNIQRAGKIFENQGQHRARSPSETLEKILPLAEKCGITRVANITGLDRIGIPVTSVVRPNSTTLATASGKGLTPEIAIVSGLMEAIELFHAENAYLQSLLTPFACLPKKIKKIELATLQLKRNSLFNQEWPEYWTEGWDIVNQEVVFVPLSSVELKKRKRAGHVSLANFQEDSNGLASGNNLLEAVCSGMLEVIERDAITCIEYAGDEIGYSPRCIDLGTVPFDFIRALLAQLEDADVSLSLFDCTTDLGIPVYKALIFDSRGEGFGPAGGYGAHLDTEVAILRAITEAIQARAVVISGSRDDVFRFDLDKIMGSSMSEFRCIENARMKQPMQDFNLATKTFHDDISVIVNALSFIGITQVIVVELKCFDAPISVVRVIIPGLEGYRWKNSYVPRARALRFSQHNKANLTDSPPSQFLHMPAWGRNA